MKRLTKREDGRSIMDCVGCKNEYIENQDVYCTSFYCRNRLKNRLADIEDILGDDYDLKHLQKLVEADRDGRCMVLPCKIGDTIYRIDYSICKWRDIDHCDSYCNGWYGDGCWEGDKIVKEDRFSIYDIDRLGKTVFLLYEEALKNKDNDNI